MFYRDHEPAHFHATYGEYEITVTIRDGVVRGEFPRRALALVLEWSQLHQASGPAPESGARSAARWRRTPTQGDGIEPDHLPIGRELRPIASRVGSRHGRAWCDLGWPEQTSFRAGLHGCSTPGCGRKPMGGASRPGEVPGSGDSMSARIASNTSLNLASYSSSRASIRL
jgi:hypothetical protein